MNIFELIASVVIVIAITALISSKFKISSKYERGDRSLSPWRSLDKGIDPTERDDQ
jgi:hypothetical protein